MEVRIDREAEDLEDQVVYLYRYELRRSVNATLTIQIAFEQAVVIPVMVAGEALPSFAGFVAYQRFSCAALNGVDATIVDRANYLAEITAKGEDLVNACTKISEKEEDDMEDAVNDSDFIGMKYEY